MPFNFRKLIPAGALLLASVGVGACNSKDNPVQPVVVPVPTALAVQATGTTTARVSFTGSAQATGYVVERAPGATGGTFAQVGTPAAGTAGSQVTFNDTGLSASTTYRYRVAALKGSNRSLFSSEVTVQTLAFGNASAIIDRDITQSRTLSADTAYTLKGFIHVTNGATLTIPAGTTIKGDYETRGSSLFILQGAKINAVGTAAAPIVFTSSQPVGSRQPGDWGGLILVGRGALSRTGDIELEGTATDLSNPPVTGTNYRVLYSGGSEATNNDNSGELSYVRVEFAGLAPSNGNELNSFTFAAVGSGTRLSYLESLAGLDDAFEWFGGAVDAKYLVSYESGDDHFDMSESYRGRLQFLIAFQDTILTQRSGSGSPSSDRQGIENDGCAGSGCAQNFNTMPYTQPLVANFTLVGTGNTATSGSAGGIGMMLRRGTAGYYVNGIVARWPVAGISIRDIETYQRAGSTPTPDLATADLALRNILVAETPAVFQPQTAGSSTIQNSFDLTGNAIVASIATTAASLFTAFPANATAATTAAAFDWTPAPGSVAATTAGLSSFTGKLSTAAAAVVTGTTYVGAAAPGGPKWWAGWTKYAQN